MDPPVQLAAARDDRDRVALAILAADAEFLGSMTFREQCARACIALRVNNRPVCPYRIIGYFLGVNPGTVKKHWDQFHKRGNVVGDAGRPGLLTEEMMNVVVNEILRTYQSHEAVALFQVRAFIRQTWGLDIKQDTLWHILHADGRIKAVEGKPMDSNRIRVPSAVIEKYLADLKRQIDGAPSHFVFNMDEMGHQDWADKRNKRCFIPAGATDEEVYFAVSRTAKRITLIACIAADGSHLRPALIIHRKTYSDDILLHGWSREKFDAYTQSKSFIDRDIFNDWFRDTFIPAVAERKEAWQYTGPSFLILDNCTAHSGQAFDGLCQRHNIVPVFLPPHSSNQTQPLDLCAFGVTKTLVRFNSFAKNEVSYSHMGLVLEAFYRAAVPSVVTASFRSAGISLRIQKAGPRGAQFAYGLCEVNSEFCKCLLDARIAETAAAQQIVPGEMATEVAERTDEEDEEDEEESNFARYVAEMREWSVNH
jgi:hypothetical protein